MRVRDLRYLNGDYDVYGDIADEIGVAFVHEGGKWLTPAAEEYFADILDIEVEIDDRNGIISVLTSTVIPEEEADLYEWGDYENYHPIAQKLSELFWGYAGWIDEEQWHEWFIED